LRGYLLYLIKESANRATVMKSLIPYPLTSVELNTLAERCTSKIDIIIQHLSELVDICRNRDDEQITRYVHRRYQEYHRELEWYEQYGIAVLNVECADFGYLNKLISRILRESNIPLNIPAVASFSNEYYFFAPGVKVIFIPPAESRFLLHMADLYHELGHYVSSMRQELQLANIGRGYSQCLEAIKLHYVKIVSRRIIESRQADLIANTIAIHDRWKSKWFEEIFCDLFAAYLVGPAYAWSHVHLIMKKNEGIRVFAFNPRKLSTHPADEARFRAVLLALKEQGFDVSAIEKKWHEFFLPNGEDGDEPYYEAFPDELLQELTNHTLDAFRQTCLVGCKPQDLENTSVTSVVSTLNRCWAEFWVSPHTFRDYESTEVEQLRRTTGG
jgi:hypothetical protein